MFQALETVLDQRRDQGRGRFLAEFFLVDFLDQVQYVLLAPHAFVEPDLIVQRTRVGRLVDDRFLLAAEAAEPQFELLHGLLVAQFLALLLVAAQVFLAVIVIVRLELLFHLRDLLGLERARQVGQFGRRLQQQRLGALLDLAVVGHQVRLRDIALQLLLARAQDVHVILQLRLAVPVEQLVDVVAHPALLVAVQVDIRVQPPVQHGIAIVVGQAQAAAAGHDDEHEGQHGISKTPKGHGSGGLRVKLLHILNL